MAARMIDVRPARCVWEAAAEMADVKRRRAAARLVLSLFIAPRPGDSDFACRSVILISARVAIEHRRWTHDPACRITPLAHTLSSISRPRVPALLCPDAHCRLRHPRLTLGLKVRLDRVRAAA